MAERSSKKELDLLDSFIKPFLDKSEQVWSEIFNQMLGSEKFAELMGRTLRGQLMVQKMLREQLDLCLRALNLPSRRDLEAITRNLEDLKAAVARLEQKGPARGPAKPRRRKGESPGSVE